MSGQKRRNRILALLEEKEAIYVSDIAKEFDVSDKTIRRDLQELEDEGLLLRFRGGATKPEKASTSVNQMELELSAEAPEKVPTKGIEKVPKKTPMEMPKVKEDKNENQKEAFKRVVIKRSKPEWLARKIENARPGTLVESNITASIKEEEPPPLEPFKEETKDSVVKEAEVITSREIVEDLKDQKNLEVIEVGTPFAPEALKRIIKLAESESGGGPITLEKPKEETPFEESPALGELENQKKPAPKDKPVQQERKKEKKKKKRKASERNKEEEKPHTADREEGQRELGKSSKKEKKERTSKVDKGNKPTELEKSVKEEDQGKLKKSDKQEGQARSPKTDKQEGQARLQKTDKQEGQARPQKTDKQEKQAKLQKSDKQEGQAKPQKSDKQEGQARPQKTDKQEGQAKPQKSDKQEGQARPQKTDKQEGQGKPQKVNKQEEQAKPKKTDKQEEQAKSKKLDKQEKQLKPKKTDIQEEQVNISKGTKHEEKASPKKANRKEEQGELDKLKGFAKATFKSKKQKSKVQKKESSEKVSKVRKAFDVIHIILAVICFIGGAILAVYILSHRTNNGGAENDSGQESVLHNEIGFHMPERDDLLNQDDGKARIFIRNKDDEIVGVVVIETFKEV